jgi:hypothetical protein
VSAAYKLLERTTRFAPLGIAFYDPATGRRVSDGLRVAYTNARGRRMFAPVNRVGVFVLRSLPGQTALERSAGDETIWADATLRTDVPVELTDTLGRFHDLVFTATAPSRGLFALACGGAIVPPGQPLGVPLFPLAGRTVPAGLAAVRAELHDTRTGEPAAWALLEVTAPKLPPALGLADRRGSVVVMLPYPEPTSPGAGSPPSHPRRSLSDEKWTVEVRAFSSAFPPDPVPDLCTILRQPAAALVASDSPPAPLTQATLEFGRELVVRTSEQPTLGITPSVAPH